MGSAGSDSVYLPGTRMRHGFLVHDPSYHPDLFPDCYSARLWIGFRRICSVVRNLSPHCCRSGVDNAAGRYEPFCDQLNGERDATFVDVQGCRPIHYVRFDSDSDLGHVPIDHVGSLAIAILT